jgi:hypothetical protein
MTRSNIGAEVAATAAAGTSCRKLISPSNGREIKRAGMMNAGLFLLSLSSAYVDKFYGWRHTRFINKASKKNMRMVI